eukprot:4613703-Prymnesium_polylepis.1
MQPEAHSVVGYSLDCLWATDSIVRQRLAAKAEGVVSGPCYSTHLRCPTACRSGHRCDGSRLP